MLKVLIYLLLFACFISFSWAVFRIFNKPREIIPFKMSALSLLSTFFFIGQLYFVSQQTTFNLTFTIIGLILLCVSFGIFWSAIPYAKSAQLGIAFAGKKSKKILMDGPYKYIRHPFYSSYLFFWIGGSLVAQSENLLISIVVMAWFYFSAIAEEETMLLNGDFGDLYKSYMLRTGAVLPRVIV